MPNPVRGGDLRILTDFGADNWPEISYRGESRRRAFTAGTLFNILDNGEGKPGDSGVWLSVLIAELTRLNSIYADTLALADVLFTMPAEVKQLLTRLENLEGVVERHPDNRLKWRLTDDGRKALNLAFSTMKKVDSSLIQTRNSIMAWAPDGYPLETLYPTDSDRESAEFETVDAEGDEPARAPSATGARYEGDSKETGNGGKEESKKLAAAYHDEDNNFDMSKEERDEIFDRDELEREDANAYTSDGIDTGHGDSASTGTAETPKSRTMMGLGTDHETTLPRRRIIRRRPTFRQWLTICHQQPGVMLGAMLHLQYYAPEDVAAALARDFDNPVAVKLKTDTRRMKTKIKRIGEFARLVLGGGPESIWVGKPLVPHTVHEEVVAFHAAGTAGFHARMIENSSYAVDLYFGSDVTLNDYESYKQFMVILERENVEQTIDSRRAELVKSVRSGDKETETRGLTDDGDIEARFNQKLALTSVDEEFSRQYGGGMSLLHQGQELLMEPGILPKRRCLHVESNEKREAVSQCRRLAAGASDFCELHGGSVLADDTELRNLMAANARKLVSMSGRALDTVYDVMVNSPNDMTRLQAAKIVLDKSGFADNIDVTIAGKNAGAGEDEETPDHLDPAKIVRTRLNRLGASLRQSIDVPEPEPEDENVIEGDVEYGFSDFAKGADGEDYAEYIDEDEDDDQ